MRFGFDIKIKTNDTYHGFCKRVQDNLGISKFEVWMHWNKSFKANEGLGPWGWSSPICFDCFKLMFIHNLFLRKDHLFIAIKISYKIYKISYF